MEFDWDKVRDSGIPPLHGSELDDSEERRAEFIRGSELLRIHGERATVDPFSGEPKVLHPQQLRFADTINAGARFSSVLFPRRSSKTTSFFALAVGRCELREGYLASYTMLTTAIKSRERFRRDLSMPLEQLYPDKKSRPFKISYAGGYERVEWDNGSMFAFLAPRGESFRSDAWDLIGLDEGGEADVETTKDVLAGVLATGDTRPGSQVVISGTAAKFRTGNILWDELEAGRAGQDGHGILEYAAPAGTMREDVDTWDKVVPLLDAHHPGINTLTRLPMLKGNYDKMDPEDFAREYLSIFGTGGATGGIFNLRQWGAGLVPGPKPVEPPAAFGLAVAVHPNQTSACIVAAWRENDKPRLWVIDHRPRVSWLVKRTLEVARKYRVPVAHDTNGPVTTEAEALGRAAPRIRLAPQSFANIKTAAALIVKEVEMGTVGHWDQPVLNDAVRLARKRQAGNVGWALGRGDDEDDITPIEAGAMALRHYDETRSQPALTPVVAK